MDKPPVSPLAYVVSFLFCADTQEAISEHMARNAEHVVLSTEKYGYGEELIVTNGGAAEVATGWEGTRPSKELQT
jgi:hypothetical protein